ncbi:MAG: hypothetical protein ACLP59_20155 [Bryobacteraceae bacterium]
MLDALELTVAGLQVRADRSAGATKFKEALWEAPFRVAVMVADCVVAIAPTVAVNLIEVVFEGTVTDAGTLSARLLLESLTTLAPDGAA